MLASFLYHEDDSSLAFPQLCKHRGSNVIMKTNKVRANIDFEVN